MQRNLISANKNASGGLVGKQQNEERRVEEEGWETPMRRAPFSTVESNCEGKKEDYIIISRLFFLISIILRNLRANMCKRK